MSPGQVEPRPGLPSGPFLVVGLARSGAAAARLLSSRGQEVMGCDSGSPAEAAGLEGVELYLESDGRDLVGRARTVVKSPGVPQEAAAIVAARAAGVEVIGELELAWRLLPNEFVAVTGTNGKTTTAELLGEIHRQAGMEVAVAGNVGTALSSLVGSVTPGAVVVCEASSFQLEDTVAFRPQTALLLNLEEDHLDRHGTFEAYSEAKLRVFANQGGRDLAVVPADWRGTVPGSARLVRFGEETGDLSLHGEELRWRGEALMRAPEIRLRGAHNLLNAMAAAAAALGRGLTPDAVAAALRDFRGVPHRLEEVAERAGVLYVNDSKATNVASARVGVESFGGGVHLILGGRLKGGSFEGLRGPVAARCRACYLIGEAAEQLEADLAGTAPLLRCGELEPAMRAASEAAGPGEVVLLSPACASYDQYASFEERGEHFRLLATGKE